MVSQMKTTIEIPDALFRQAKVIAARRHTTLKAMIEQALRLEISQERLWDQSGRCFDIDEDGLPIFGQGKESTVTSGEVYELMDDLGV